jgi:serine/threonine-protein kinase
MPQRIAMVKIRGFVHDAGGEVVESEAGLIRVRLGGSNSKPSRNFAPFGKPGQPLQYELDLELRLLQVDERQENRLQVTVVFYPPDKYTSDNAGWRRQCEKLFCEVRGYLIG